MYASVDSVAERVKAPFVGQSCDHNVSLCSTLTLIAQLHPWIRHFTTIISAWWHRTNSKLSGKKSNQQPENLEISNS